MKIVAIVECHGCQTYEKVELSQGENIVRGCICGYYGEEDKKITLKIENR